jgi:hypothetical protein
VNYINIQDQENTPLQACVLSKSEDHEDWMGIETAELLILNGAKLDNSTTGNKQNVLDTALLGNADQQMMQYLTARIS